jgi:PKD domain
MRSAAVLAVLIVLTGASAASAAPAWIPRADLSPAGAFPRVAVSASGDAVAVWEHSDGNNFIVQAATRRPGERFSIGPDLSAPGSDARAPQAALDEAGNAIVVWVRAGVVQAVMRPAGGRFSAPANLSSPGAQSPDLAVDRSGNAVVVWAQAGGLIKAVTRPAGGSFSAPVDLSAMGVSAEKPQVAIDAAGGAIAAWRRVAGTSSAIQRAIRPAGGGFSAPADLSPPTGQADTPALAMDEAGNAVAAWQQRFGSDLVIVGASRPAGADFAAPEPLSETGRNASSPAVAIGAAGNAVVAWARQRPGPPGAPDEIQAATRAAGGSFSQPVDVSDLTVPGGPSVAPQAAMDAAGDAVVVWRRMNGQGNYQAQAATRSASGRFARAVDLSPPEDYVLNGDVAMDGAGNAVAVWPAFKGTAELIQASVYDATPPQLDGLSVPASGVVGTPVSFSVSPFDAWTAVSSTWSFGDAAGGSGSAPTHVFTAPGTYRVAVNVRDEAGNLAERASEIAIAAQPALRIARLRIAPAAFARRARVSYRLNRAATIRFRVSRQGRRGRFVAMRGGFARASAAGANRFTFNGRLRGRRLRPGRYRLTAVGAAGGRSARVPFRVLASRAGAGSRRSRRPARGR